MATIYKPFLNDDMSSTRTLLHESIPLTGTIVSGTYSDNNVKNFSHGMFQSVYDYPYLSSSSNHVFDITCGYSSKSALSSSSNSQNSKKIAIYNQMAQVLVGHDVTGSILRFDRDGDLTDGAKLNEVYFLNLSRLVTKDEIKKGTFSLSLLTGSSYIARGTQSWNLSSSARLTISDAGAATSYKTNSPAGEYSVLYTSSAEPNSSSGVGLLYYQAGVAVVTASVFDDSIMSNDAGLSLDKVDSILTGSTIQVASDSFRHRIDNFTLNNTTELNSTIYFCRVNHNEYNYSANPTYTSGSKIRVKNNTLDNPTSYITTVGLYSADNELLAVAKLSEPLKKDPTNEMILRVRLDY